MHTITLIAEDDSPITVAVDAPRYEDAIARLAAALTRHVAAAPEPPAPADEDEADTLGRVAWSALHDPGMWFSRSPDERASWRRMALAVAAHVRQHDAGRCQRCRDLEAQFVSVEKIVQAKVAALTAERDTLRLGVEVATEALADIQARARKAAGK